MKGRLVRCVSVLMGVLAAFDSGACVARRKRKNKFQNNFSKVNKLKKVKVTGKESVPLVIKDPVVVERSVPVIVEKPVVVPVGLSVKYDRTPPLVRLLERWSEASLGNKILSGALFLDVLAESVMGFKRLFDWLDVDSARLSAKSYLSTLGGIDLAKSNKFLNNIGFHTVYIYADKLFDGALTRGFLFSFLDVASDVAISAISDMAMVKQVENDRTKKSLLCASLVCLCVALFSSNPVEGSEEVIRCFLEACLDAGCVKLDKEGKICKGDGYPWRWALTPFRHWGSDGNLVDYFGDINNAAVKNGLSKISLADGQVFNPVVVTNGGSSS